MTLRTLNYGNYGIFLIMGNAGFCPSAVSIPSLWLVKAGQSELQTGLRGPYMTYLFKDLYKEVIIWNPKKV